MGFDTTAKRESATASPPAYTAPPIPIQRSLSGNRSDSELISFPIQTLQAYLSKPADNEFTLSLWTASQKWQRMEINHMSSAIQKETDRILG